MSNTEELCQSILDARNARDTLKEQLKAAEVQLETLEGQLATTLTESDDAKLTYEGYSFSAATKVGWKTMSEGRETLVGLLREAVPELVKETVNAASLSSYLRKNETSLEKAQETWWVSAKDCLVRSETSSLSVRKSTKKKKKS